MSDVESAHAGGTLVISELFGPTWQGEGASLGTRAAFVRLGRCNLACTWCDTPYTWDWERYDPEVELTRLGVDEIARRVENMRAALVVITGGEPLLQQSHLPPLLQRLSDAGHRIEIETAGTLAPRDDVTALVDRFNVSPKLANSGNPLERRYRPDALRALATTNKAAFKFVACSCGDLDEIASIVDECAIPDDAVWVMPEGTTAPAIIAGAKDLADGVLERGWNMTTRLHVLLWGDERGR